MLERKKHVMRRKVLREMRNDANISLCEVLQEEAVPNSAQRRIIIQPRKKGNNYIISIYEIFSY